MRKLCWLVGVVLAATLTGFSDAGAPAAQRAPRHFSLLIGAGNYKYASEWKDLKNLNGPRNDVRRMQATLRGWSFPGGPNQRILVDSQASKAGIAEAFRWLASQATDTSDVVVIFYSGHGSWAPDLAIDDVRTRDEASPADTGDRFDEGLVPWDARDPHNPRHLILDDEIGAWLDRIGTRNITVIVDACFSGTVTRGGPDGESETAPVAKGPRPPPFAKLSATGGMMEGGRRMNHTLLTAASSAELAYEKTFHPGAVVSGIFTRNLADALDGANRSSARFDDLLQQVRTKIGTRQTPQLEGDRTARIFRVGAGTEVPSRGYAITRNDSPRRVGLDAGAVHGVRKGTLYDVYGPNETEFRAGRIAQVRVDSVLEASSFATVERGGGTLPNSGRATLSRVPAGAMALNRLKLYVHPSARPMRDSLAGVEWLELTDQPSRAMAELRRRGQAYQIIADGHEVPPLAADISSGRAVRADSMSGYVGSLRGLCTPLRRAYSVAAMNLVRNEQPPSNLKIEIRVLPAGSPPPMSRSRATVDTMYVGQRYDIWVWVEIPDEAVQRSSLYLTAGFAGYSWVPAAIWPRTETQTRLVPEQMNAPVQLRAGISGSVPGIENIKAVVSSDPYNLHSLVGELPRCPIGAGDILARGDMDAGVVTGWTAVTRRVEIHTR